MQQQIAKKNISIIDLIRFDIYNIVELEACRRLYKRVMYDIWTI